MAMATALRKLSSNALHCQPLFYFMPLYSMVMELIPLENFTSVSMIQAVRSIMTNKCSEGYLAARYYGGNEYSDMAESLCQKRALVAFHLDPEKWGAEESRVKEDGLRLPEIHHNLLESVHM